jgi:sulfur carrier protein ThiS
MLITMLPQRRQVEFAGRHRVSEVLKYLGLLPGTAMVIRRDELVPENEFVEADEHIEVRNVISGG